MPAAKHSAGLASLLETRDRCQAAEACLLVRGGAPKRIIVINSQAAAVTLLSYSTIPAPARRGPPP